MTLTIFPTVGDTISEVALAQALADAGGNYVPSGFTVASTSGLNVTLAAGRAMIAGRNVAIDTTSVVAVANSTTTYIYLQATLDGLGNMTGAAFVTNTTGVTPANAVPICLAVASGGVITSTKDRRATNIAPAIASGEYTGDGTTRTMQIGFTPRRVFIGSQVDNTGTSGGHIYNLVGLNRGAFIDASVSRIPNTKIVSGGFVVTGTTSVDPNWTGILFGWFAIG